MDLIGSNQKYYIANGANDISKWYVDGIETTVTAGSVYVDTTLNQWHHHYFEFNSAPTELRWFGYDLTAATRYRGTGKLDDVRMFNTGLNSAQINDLLAGGTGNPPTGSRANLSINSDGFTGVGIEDAQEQLDVSGAITLREASGNALGTIQWTGTDFQGYIGGGEGWVSLTNPTLAPTKLLVSDSLGIICK